MNNNFQKNFQEGFNYYQNSSNIQIGGLEGQEYINKVTEEIKKCQNECNSIIYNHNTTPDQGGGFIAEEWHKGTFNINARIKGKDSIAIIPERSGSLAKQFAQPDITTSTGEQYGSKYYNYANKTAMEQAKSYWERFNEKYHGTDKSFEEFLTERGLDAQTTNKFASIYEGQFRLVPKDQLNDVISVLERKILEKEYRGADVSGLKETLNHITDRVRNSEGIESIPLSKEDSRQLAILARDGKLNIEKFGIKTESLISYEDIFKKGINSGISAAIISTVLKIAPDIYKAIDKLIKDGQLNNSDLINLGTQTVKNSTQGFIYGSISASITSACLAGKFGKSLKSINPTIIATFTVLVINTISYSIKLSNKKITKQEFANNITKDLFISTCSTGLGSFTQALLPELPIFAFLLGSLIGAVAGSFIYKKEYNNFMSLCCDTGFSCFGLVEQDYKIPDAILHEMNIKTFDFSSFEFHNFDFSSFEFHNFDFSSFGFNSSDYETIDYHFLSRDVIGVFKVGYTVK